MKKLFIITLFLALTTSYGQQIDPLKTIDAQAQEKWVDSILNKLTLKSKNRSIIYGSSIF